MSDPGFPGDVRNPSAYPFPIQYEVCKGVDIHQLVEEEETSALPSEPILLAPRKLRVDGVPGRLPLNVAILPTSSGKWPLQ